MIPIKQACKMIPFAAMLCLPLQAGALAAEFTVLTHSLPPFTTVTAAPPTGLAVELVETILRHTGDTGKVQVVPYSRLMQDVQRGPSTIGFIVARTPAREALMQWVGPILVTPVFLYMKAGALMVPRTLSESRTLGAIGVTRGGVDAQYFADNGFSNLDIGNSQATDLGKVNLGRLDATPMGAIVFDNVLAEIGLKRSDFLRAPFILYKSFVYAAVSPDVPVSAIAAWSAALDAMKRSGEYTALLTRYGIVVDSDGLQTDSPTDRN